jgi:hypothetical protein
MALITFEKITLKDRKYPSHTYKISMYTGSSKINLHAIQGSYNVTLKMSLEETKELITRLQFAVHEAERNAE